MIIYPEADNHRVMVLIIIPQKNTLRTCQKVKITESIQNYRFCVYSQPFNVFSLINTSILFADCL